MTKFFAGVLLSRGQTTAMKTYLFEAENTNEALGMATKKALNENPGYAVHMVSVLNSNGPTDNWNDAEVKQ